MEIVSRVTRSGRPRVLLSTAIVAAVLLIALGLAMNEAQAIETDTYRLEPHPLVVQGDERRSFRLDIAPGSAATDAVRITNKTDQPRTFRLYAADAIRDPETDAIAVAPDAAEPRAVGSWISIERREITLLPRASDIISFTVSRPQDVPAEGMGAVVAEEVREAEGSGIDVVHRLAILVRMDGEAGGLGMADAKLRTPIELIPSTGTASATVTNDTLQPVDTTVRFEVESLTGQIWQLDPVEVRLDPGESQPVSQQWTTVPRWGGILRVNAEAHWEAGSVSTSSPRNVHLPLWLLALVIGLTGIRALRIMWDDRRNGPGALPRKRSTVDNPVDEAVDGRAPTPAGADGGAPAEAPADNREPVPVP